MIIFSSNCVTSDGVDVILFASSSFTDNQLLFEIMIQYIDDSSILYSKTTMINCEPSKDDLLYTYQSKINRALKTVNARTLSRLFKFNLDE